MGRRDALRNFNLLLLLLLPLPPLCFSWGPIHSIIATRIRRSRLATGTNVDDVPVARYYGPVGEASEMEATVELDRIGLALEVGPSVVAPGELGMFVRLREGVKQSKCWRLTLMCDYARDGTFSLVDSGDKSVWFVLKTASGVVFDGQVMSIGAALEEASVAHGCECGLAGHEVGRRREEGDTINDDSSDTITVEATMNADDEQFKRCYIPSLVEKVTGRSFGQFTNDLAWGEPPPACEEEYNARAERNNCLSLIWSVEYDEALQQLVPRWPMYVLSQDLIFGNEEPMEVGGTYGWDYWQVPTREDRVRSDNIREVIHEHNHNYHYCFM
jgi:hypothetical protein